MAIFLVEEHLARTILEGISEAGGFDKKPGSGIAFQMDIEDAMGLTSQIGAIKEEIEDQL